MTTHIRGLNKVVSNINDAISLVSTAQGTTSEAINIVQRIRELTVQGLSDTNGGKDKAHIQTEIEALIEGLRKLVKTQDLMDEIIIEQPCIRYKLASTTGTKYIFTPTIWTRVYGPELSRQRIW